jgi:protein required for attachment to host cells
MDKIWVLVAESSRAKLFEQDFARSDLHELKDFDHSASRLHDQDLVSSAPGRAFDSKGNARHAIEPETDPKVNETHLFARMLAHHLDQHCEKKFFNKLVLVAPPEFLGILRSSLSDQVNKLIVAEINKNLVRETKEQIQAHLPYSF